MSTDSISKCIDYCWTRFLCAIMACAILSMVPISVAAQVLGDQPVFDPGLHRLKLVFTDGSAIDYAISIPSGYSSATPVPLILALHFGVGRRNPAGAGRDVVQVLFGPALEDLGAIIVAPDTVRGNWRSPENEKAVNALLDMVLAHYSIDKNKVAVTGYSMGGAGSWHFAEKFPCNECSITPFSFFAESARHGAGRLIPPRPAGGRLDRHGHGRSPRPGHKRGSRLEANQIDPQDVVCERRPRHRRSQGRRAQETEICYTRKLEGRGRSRRCATLSSRWRKGGARWRNLVPAEASQLTRHPTPNRGVGWWRTHRDAGFVVAHPR
jgi:hypothetical protein